MLFCLKKSVNNGKYEGFLLYTHQNVPSFQQLRSVKMVSNVNPKLQTLQAHASLLFGNILASQGNQGINWTVNLVHRYTPSCFSWQSIYIFPRMHGNMAVSNNRYRIVVTDKEASSMKNPNQSISLPSCTLPCWPLLFWTSASSTLFYSPVTVRPRYQHLPSKLASFIQPLDRKCLDKRGWQFLTQ